jgi:hypothetical protein
VKKDHITVDDLTLAGGGPNVLQVTVTLGEAVEGVIALTAGTDEAAKSVGLVLTSVATVLVNLADGELDGGVVVGLDDAVGGAALAGHVAVESKVMLVVWVLFVKFEDVPPPALSVPWFVLVTRNDRNSAALGIFCIP